MRSYFRLKLSVILILFALAISFTLSTTDHFRLKEQVVSHHQNLIRQNEETVQYALKTIEKAYHLFGEHIALTMQKHSLYLLDLYDRNPNFDEWDFQELKNRFSMDVYIIDSANKITHSSYPDDIGLDFSVCCNKLSQVLNERRSSGGFYHDGIDIEQKSGRIKKYSYMATRDKKYLIQLGYSLEDEDIFKQFNFLGTADELVQKYASIYAIHILNTGGYPLGKPADSSYLSPERRAAFEHTLRTGQPSEVSGHWENEPATYHYTRYSSEFDTGTTKYKVLEIVYTDRELQAVLGQNRNAFIYRLGIVLLITVALALVVSRWAGKLMHLAYHDSLTGLKNRAAFNELLQNVLAGNRGTTALLMIDLDNFKLVNDYYGHDKGDELLRGAAQCICSSARKHDIPIRLGGDEFVLIMPSATAEEAMKTAADIIDAIKALTEGDLYLNGEKMTTSIGIALAPVHGADVETLCKKADLALYASKEQGKNRYCLYEEGNGR